MPPTGSPRPDLSWVRPGVGAVAVHSYEHVLKPAGKPSKRKFLSFAAGDAFTIVKKGKDVSEPATASFAVDVCFIDSYIEYNINASETGVIFYPFSTACFVVDVGATPPLALSCPTPPPACACIGTHTTSPNTIAHGIATPLVTQDWWLAKEASTGETGYVPVNFFLPTPVPHPDDVVPDPTVSPHTHIAAAALRPYPWFRGRVTREQSEQLLSGAEPGTFIVRESTAKPGMFSLSVRCVPQPRLSPTLLLSYQSYARAKSQSIMSTATTVTVAVGFVASAHATTIIVICANHTPRDGVRIGWRRTLSPHISALSWCNTGHL